VSEESAVIYEAIENEKRAREKCEDGQQALLRDMVDLVRHELSQDRQAR